MPRTLLFYCLVLIWSTGNYRLHGQAVLDRETGLLSNIPAVSHITSAAELQKFMDSIRDLHKSDPNAAMRLYIEIGQQSRRLRYDKGVVAAIEAQGNIYSAKGHYREALVRFEKAIRFCLSNRDSLGIYLSELYNNAGKACRDLGDMEAASSYLFKAVQAVETIPGSLFPKEEIYSSLSVIVPEPRQKLYYLDKADSVARAVNNRQVLARVLLNKFVAYSSLQQYEKSDQVLWEALATGREMNDTLIQYRALTRLAMNKNTRDKPDSALLLLRMAGKLNPAGETDVFQRNADLLLWGHTYFQFKNYRKAIAYYALALANAQQFKLLHQEAIAYDKLAQSYAATGQFEEAYRHHVLFTEAKDSVVNERVTNNINTLEAKYQSAAKDKALAEKQLLLSRKEMQLHRKNRILFLFGGISAALLLIGLLALRSYRHRRRLLLQQEENRQLKAVMKGEEQERARLARELHDGIGGMLVAVNMKLNAIKKEMSAPALAEMESMLREAGTEVRKTAHNLMPDVLDKHTLREALVLFCNRVSDSGDTQIRIQFHNMDDITDKTMSLALYRIIQELVQNILRHAHARHAEIQLICYDRLLSLTVEDDGKGFDTDNHGGLGLENIRHRVNVLRGAMSVTSQQGKGTTVHIEFDLDNVP